MPSGPPQDPANPSGPTRLPNGTTTSLPSRHRDSSTIDSERADSSGNSQHFFPHMHRQVDGTVEGGIVDVDMDFPTDFGLGERNPPSDHPTPSTLNSSSNTSYSLSGVDNPSPGKKQHMTAASPATSFDKVNSAHIPPSTTATSRVPDMGSMAGQIYPNSTGSMGTTGAPNAFPMASTWDVPTPNPAVNNVDFGNVNVDGLNEAQWAQILNNSGSGAGWGEWRPS
jgi:hypothetical protein